MTRKERKEGKNWLQWLVFGIGAVTTLGLVGVLGWDAATVRSRPPECHVTLGEPVREAKAFRVPVRVENRRGDSAENVRVDVELIRGSEAIETGSVTFAFLPRGATRDGAVTFENDPARVDRVRARCAGYEVP